eukprot:gnl/MRDRNA2_/MRDRNA2_114934_c0_seq1.p1 gnl/MRDRNA2_/MRDRNA2_114934_c0~~gnl/MRDRNA2_/MRDRNA2_114934_c0_seq1.p1  ORF type:complete len:910 (+),score=206.89 gnl/MRDRNA2_/MRDRNA2_114934_c0_seq1:124-2853(+)
MGKPSDAKYFQTTKRGEIQELKEELHTGDKTKTKEAVKKVIAAMTVGKDVSALFPDVVNCIQTDNIELKKLVYLYVLNYAKSQPELAILAINTFRKDSEDSNPLVRALAVRTMGCIRLDQVTEYLLEPLRKCCQDSDPFVRKTAAICIPKVFEINPELVDDQGFVDILKDMLSDANPMVVANAVAGLTEISETRGKGVLNLDDEATIPKLLAALNECTEWGQVFILDALAMYKPVDSKDAESIVERITARLSHANPSVVLAAIKVVLKYVDFIDSAEAQRTLCKKLSAPLVTLLSNEFEIQFVALRNIRLIVQKRPGILATDVKMFFCKYNDPAYVKLEKVEIMVSLVSERNVEQVLLELKEYATGVDIEFVRKSVRALGRVAVKLERASERVISVLLELIETKVNYVVQEAVVVIKDIFRKYPTRYEQVLGALCDNLEILDEPEAKASMIWILGEYAERIDNVDEILDTFLDTFHEDNLVVQLQLLTAVVKLFLKMPGSTQDMVSKVLRMATEESPFHDLRDRGYIYWRLLSTNPEATKKVVLGDKPAIRDESSMLEKNLLDKLIAELALMSSVYHKDSMEFVTRVSSGGPGDAFDEDDDEEGEGREAKMSRLRDEMANMDSPDTSTKANGSAPAASGGGGDMLDLLDLGGPSEPAPAAVVTPSVTMTQALPSTTKGQGGNSGIAISTAVVRQNGQIAMKMEISNSAPMVANGFAIQINKNSFGLGPGAPLQVPDCAPGGRVEAMLPLMPNQLMNGQPPSNPLFLQAAVKCSVDIFYFNIPFELSVLFVEEANVDREAFRAAWQRIGEERQISIMATSSRQLSAEGGETSPIAQQLKGENMYYVAGRSGEGFNCVYIACKTTNNLAIFSEITLQTSGPQVKLATRTDVPPLVEPFHKSLCKILGLTAR